MQAPENSGVRLPADLCTVHPPRAPQVAIRRRSHEPAPSAPRPRVVLELPEPKTRGEQTGSVRVRA